MHGQQLLSCTEKIKYIGTIKFTIVVPQVQSLLRNLRLVKLLNPFGIFLKNVESVIFFRFENVGLLENLIKISNLMRNY